MNYAGKFDATLPADGTGPYSHGHGHVETITQQATHAPVGAIIVADSQLLFNGDYKRSGVDLILSKDDQKLVLHDYFKGEKQAALSSPDGAHLTGDIVNALTGHTQYAQADGSASANHVIGHVTKLIGSATVIRNGVSVILNNGDNVEKGDVVTSGANSTLGITFIDGTVFGLSSNARMVLNEMVYDPNGSNNSSLLSLVSGTITFVAGETAKHGDMKVDTPVATMGIRGTAVLSILGEIDFNVPIQNQGQPTGIFQVLVEPDGTTGSYILFDKTTLAPIATVNQAGQQINISNGQVSVTNSALPPDIQKLITDVFSLKFSNANPQTFEHFTDIGVPQQLQSIMLANLATATPFVLTVDHSGDPIQHFALPPTNSNQHIAGPPAAAAGPATFTELAGKTHDTADVHKISGLVNYADINAGDVPTVTTGFSGYTYQDAAHNNLKLTLNALQIADIEAVGKNVTLLVDQDPNRTNHGSATWHYNVPDGAFDFLAAGETLQLTYVADVDNNFALNPEHTLVFFTITITGTNDLPVITTGPQSVQFFGGTTTVGGPLTTTDALSGTLAFDDADLTDTHHVDAALTGTVMRDSEGTVVAGFTIPPTPLAAFQTALTASLATDSTGSGSGTINWTLADLPAYLADFIPAGDTLTLTYTVTVTDSQNTTSTQTVTVKITGNENPAEVWIATTASGTHDWHTGTNWETGLVPTANDDTIIITHQLVGKTPVYPVTIDAAAAAKSLTMSDFGGPPPELDNNSTLAIGDMSHPSADAVFSLSVDAIVHNASTGTITIGGKAEVQDASQLINAGTIILGNGGDFKDSSIISNSGTIELAGGTLNVFTDVTNSHLIKVDSTAALVLNGSTVTNAGGEIDAAAGGEIDLENAIINGGTLGGLGTIATATGNTDSTLNGVTIASGSKVTAAVGTLDLTGTITNTGAEIDATTPGIIDLENATINGGTLGGLGTIATATGNTDSTLNGVTIASGSKVTAAVGTLDLTGTITNTGAEIDATTGKIDLENATINGGTLGGAGTIDVVTASTIAGTAALNSALNTSTVTVDAKLTLNDVTVTGTTITDKSSIEFDGNVTLTGGATIQGQSSLLTGVITNLGTLEIAGAATLLYDSLTNTGHTVQIDASQTLNFDSSTITGGTLTILGELDSTGTSFITDATIINSSNIHITSGTLTIDPAPFTNTGTMLVTGGSTLVLDGETVTNSDGATKGTIQIDGPDPTTHLASILDLKGSTIDGGHIVVSGDLDSTGNSFLTGADITYSGIIDVTGGTLIIDATSTLNNTGTGKLETNGGNLIVNTSISGNLEIKGASLLELGSALQDAYKSAIVTFDLGSTGTLKLDHADAIHATHSGGGFTDLTVVGLEDDNTLDLGNIAFGTNLTVTYTGDKTGGILSIFNGVNDVSDIHLSGDYTGANWVLSGDGSSTPGTDVTEAPGALAGLDSHGNAVEGTPVTVSITDAGLAVASGITYQWQLDGHNISNATGASYTPTETDEGHRLTVNLSFTDAANNHDTSSVSAGTVQDIVLGFTSQASITGTAQEGSTLTAVKGALNDSDAAVTGYQWQFSADNGAHWNDIATNGTSQTYKPIETDEGHLLRVVETATDSDGGPSVTSISAATTAVSDITLAFTSQASISGTAQESVTLTAVNGALNDSDAAVTGYQWQFSSNGGSTWHNITTNGTSQTYTATEADEGHLLRVVETATDSDGGPSTTSTSAATGAVTEASMVPSITAGSNTHGTATFNVDFAVAMTGVGSADFTLFTTNGVTLFDNINVSGSGTHYTVTVNYPTGPLFSESHTSLGLNFVNFHNSVQEASDGSLGEATHITTPQFSSLAPAGIAGYAINLSLADPTVDPADMVTLTVTGAAADWSLNAGTHNSDGSWTVHTSDPASLMIMPSTSFVGAALVHVTETWINPDGTAGNVLITDNVEAYAPGSPIFAIAGDDHLTGAGANDLFVFAQPIGHDVIYNFNAASDKIDLIDFNNVSSFADIQGHIADDANGNAVIDIGPNETITLNGVHAASVTASDFVFDQTPVTQNAGSMTIGDGAILPLSGTINNTGTIELNSTGDETDLQLVEHGITLQGGGHVVLSDSAENVIGGTSTDVTLTNVDNTISGAGQIGAGQLTLVNEGTIDATGTNSLSIDTGVNAVTNSGTLEATGSGGLVIQSDVVNSGLLWANGGNVTVQGEVSGNGIARIDGAGALDFKAPATANVVFGSAAAGTLKLEDSFHFNGTISNFAGSDVIDLANLGSAAVSIGYHENAAGTGGTLAISNGAQTVELSFLGNYSADNFSLVPDQAKGTMVTYVPPHHDLVV